MKKQITAILTTAMMLCTNIPAVAVPLEISVSAENVSSVDTGKMGYLTYQTYDDHVEIIGCTLTAESVTIPAMIDEKPVTVIKEGAFEGCNSLNFVFSNSSQLQTISANAFAGCENLKDVILQGQSLKSIGERAFADCPYLDTVHIMSDTCEIFDSPDTIPAKTIVAHEGSNAVAYAEKYDIAVTLVEPYGTVIVDDVEYYVFEDHAVLMIAKPSDFVSGLKIPSTVNGVPVKEIAPMAFDTCHLLESLEIPDTVESIGERAFVGCYSLANITIPSSVKEIGEEAFGIGNGGFSTPWLQKRQKENPLVIVNDILVDASTTKGAVAIPESVKSIIPKAFWNNQEVTSVTIPEGVEKIQSETFSECLKLRSVEIPNTVKEIENGAFHACETMQSIIIPESVEKIGVASFIHCDNLKAVTIMNPDCELDDSSGEIFYNQQNIAGENVIFNGVIYGYSGSTAQTYAETYGRRFIALDSEPLLGDIDGDGAVTASDASELLIGASKIGVGESSGWNILQEKCADMNGDSAFDSTDGAMIFEYATYVGAGGTDSPNAYFQS